jgi:hypothetical protein
MLIKTFLETAGTFEEREMLSRFHNGVVQATGSQYNVEHYLNGVGAFLDIGQGYSPCDVAVMLGSWKNRDKNHHQVRSSIAGNANCFLVIETPLLGRIVDFTKNKHFRIGVNGFLNNSGLFYQGNCPQDRLEQLGINWNGWQNNKDGHIVLMLQLPGDASLRGINIYEWTEYCIKKIRSFSDRKIVIRTHPAHNIKETDEFYRFIIENLILSKSSNIEISLSKEKSLDDDLKGAYCTITYSSGSGIDSIMKGIPTIAMDPGNFAWNVSSRYPNEVENLKLAEAGEITQWLSNLAYSQWSVEEMEQGKPWMHLLPIINTIVENSRTKKKK